MDEMKKASGKVYRRSDTEFAKELTSKQHTKNMDKFADKGKQVTSERPSYYEFYPGE